MSHFPYVTFFKKAVVIFFVYMSRRRVRSIGSIQLVYFKKNLFLFDRTRNLPTPLLTAESVYAYIDAVRVGPLRCMGG